LRRGGDVLLHSQMGEKSFDFRDAHFLWMPFVMEQDIALDPVDIGLFGANRVVFDAYGLTNLVKKFLGTFFHLPPLSCCIFEPIGV